MLASGPLGKVVEMARSKKATSSTAVGGITVNVASAGPELGVIGVAPEAYS